MPVAVKAAKADGVEWHSAGVGRGSAAGSALV